MTKTNQAQTCVPFFAAMRDILSGKWTETKGEPDDEVKEGEKVVGVIDDPVLRSLFCFTHGVAEEGIAIMKTPIAILEIVERLEKLERLEKKVKLVSQLFWIGVKEQFPDAEKDGQTLSIRKGWKIVSRENVEKQTSTIELVGIPVPPGLLEALCK